MVRLLIGLALAIASSRAFAERTLSEKEILARCYAQLTGERLGYADPLWRELNSKSALTVCASLINQVSFGADGVLTEPGNYIHRRILKQFHDIHRDWFISRWVFGSATPDSHYGTVDVYDPSEPSMYITRALFTPNTHYANALRGTYSLKAVRDASTVTQFGRGSSNFLRITKAFAVGDVPPETSTPAGVLDRHAVTLEHEPGQFSEFGANLLQVGTLTGIQVTSLSDGTFPLLWTNVFVATATRNPAGLLSPQPVHAHFGGGALGSIPFVMMNLGHPTDYVADGAAKLPRRAISAAFQAFMCNSGPYSRETDVLSYQVAPGVGVAPFRQAASCLRCHATLDQSAMTMRNLRSAGSLNFGPASFIRGIMTVSSYAPVNGPAENNWPAVSTPNYYLTKPTGKLFFRSVNGSLVDVPVENLDGLGTAMSNTDDFYACAASRYFKYFTGIGVQIYDPQDPNNAVLNSSMSDADREYRNYVLSLAKELKAGGSLKTLIVRIMNSPYYKLAGFGR